MKGLIALPIQDADYWHDEAVVVAADAKLQEEIDRNGQGNMVLDLIQVEGWPSSPEQPILLVWEGKAESDHEYMPRGKCRLLTEHEWRLVAEGRASEVVS